MREHHIIGLDGLGPYVFPKRSGQRPEQRDSSPVATSVNVSRNVSMPTVRHMPEMTLSQASEWAGKTRSTVFKAIKGGRLSARRTDDGQWMIDPAELARVYSPGDRGNISGNSAGERHDTGRETGETEALKQVNALLQEQVHDLRTERDRLLGVIEAQTRLLTDQRPEMRRRWWPWG